MQKTDVLVTMLLAMMNVNILTHRIHDAYATIRIWEIKDEGLDMNFVVICSDG